ncbi:hypothetical protein [Bacteroides sp. UBA939]|uniref:hypothetical protein n=1 Tax=Bacteroides sp. UBA939 TaxID=1946092 RepID=UPI0025C1468E|nr:hypothetical protein [Bacteroides sp. UBA939]
MKHIVLISISVVALVFASCNESTRKAADTAHEESAVVKLNREEIKAASFDDLFKTIEAKDVKEDIFTLISEDFSILTAGTPSHYNSMVAGWGGWGILFNKQVAFSFLRSNRYTLELIRKENKYTMTFFDEEYKEDIMNFGKSSGRDSNEKMTTTSLTAVQTPSGNMAYKEAKLIIELDLFEVTTVSPDDFRTEDARKFIVDAHAETGEYHKMVFGEIKNVWERK